MGHGIAQVSAQAGYKIVAVESNAAALEVGLKRIQDSLKKVYARDVKKQTITEVSKFTLCLFNIGFLICCI
jgi:3-hydroxyacyl-CoA dehydrogenase